MGGTKSRSGSGVAMTDVTARRRRQRPSRRVAFVVLLACLSASTAVALTRPLDAGAVGCNGYSKYAYGPENAYASLLGVPGACGTEAWWGNASNRAGGLFYSIDITLKAWVCGPLVYNQSRSGNNQQQETLNTPTYTYGSCGPQSQNSGEIITNDGTHWDFGLNF